MLKLHRLLASSALLAVTAVSANAATAAFAQPGPVGSVPAARHADGIEATITQLPRTAVPRHYTVAITPDAANLRFAGRVAIDVDVTVPTPQLTLNAKDLVFGKVTVRSKAGGDQTGSTLLRPATQTAVLTFSTPLTPGQYTLTIDYTGVINQQANGLFALDSRAPDGSPRRSLYTQFEAADARAVVPSWDEPDYKALWDLSVVVPADQMAIGNMPSARVDTLTDGSKRVTFVTTPLMSSYLLFFASGDFGRITQTVGATEVAVTTTRGNEAKARTALAAEAQVLAYYNDYFGTPYPLPKLENIAGPGQSQFFGAMENWGAIFTFERILLDDPAITTERDRQAIFNVQAHEMAHQWFGNLVTMAWWDDLWLNEGFASWMATRTTEHFHPDWAADLERVAARDEAMEVDAFATTHPIVQSVKTVEQANQAFDTITYSKGESVISMLESYAGAAVWQRGIAAYIAKHQYQNTRSDDLWGAVEAAGAPGLTRIAHDFTLQPGIPLLRVGPAICARGTSQVRLMQDNFTEDRRDGPARTPPTAWRVPVRAQTIGAAPMTVLTAAAVTQAVIPGCGAVLINAGQAGYYRTLYQPAQVAALTAAYPALAEVDQYGLLTDNLALSRAGYQPVAIGLDLLAAVPASANRKLIARAVAEWQAVYDLYDGDRANQAVIAAEIDRRFTPLLTGIGLSPRVGEAALDAGLRSAIIAALGRVGNPMIEGEARRLFASPATIPGSLKAVWLGVVARRADAATWERLHSLAKQASGAVERTTYYQLLGVAEDATLAQRALDLALTAEPGPTVSSAMIRAVADAHPERTLDFALANLTAVRKLVDTSGWSRFLAELGTPSRKPATIAKLNGYASANVAASDRRPIERATLLIATRIAQMARMKTDTAAWLTRRAGRGVAGRTGSKVVPLR